MHTIWLKTQNKKCNKTTKYNLSHKLIKSVPKKKKKNPAFISTATNCNKIQSEQNTNRKCNEIRKYNLSHKLMKSEQNKNKQKKKTDQTHFDRMSLAVGKRTSGGQSRAEDEDVAILSLVRWSTTPIFLLEIAPLSLFLSLSLSLSLSVWWEEIKSRWWTVWMVWGLLIY